MHTSSGIIIFVKQGLSFLELSTSFLFLFDPHSNYVGVNTFLSNSLLLSFPNVYAPPIHSFLMDSRTDSFSPSILPSSTNFFVLGASISITSSGFQKVLPTPMERKYSIGSSLLTSSPSMTLRYLPFSIAPLQSLLLCSWEELQKLGSYHLPIILTIPLSPVFFPTKVPLLSIFRKLAGMTLPFTLTLTVLLQRNTCLFLLQLLSLFL